jgi:Zn finger protein HypA/HybF involved in hydrogenase expression
MHEHVYVNQIVKEAVKHGLVEAITVEVGELAIIPSEELEEALQVTKWEVKVIVKPATVECKCTFTGRPKVTEKGHDFNIYHCPACGRLAPKILDGKDVVLKEVRVKDEEGQSIIDVLFHLPKLF